MAEVAPGPGPEFRIQSQLLGPHKKSGESWDASHLLGMLARAVLTDLVILVPCFEGISWINSPPNPKSKALSAA